MDSKQSKILFSALVLIWCLIISATGFYVMGYMSELSFNIKWLLNFIFSTPSILAVMVLSVLFKKKA